MKKIWKIVSRVLISALLTVYVIVALLNYSLVQSTLGALAGDYFSREWGGEVRIGSLHAMPFDHLILDNVLLVSPEGDTIFDIETLRVGFRHFPYRDHGLDLDHVYMRNAYYHMSTESGDINLKYIIDYFKPKHPKDKPPAAPFTVRARSLELEHVHYKMDLPDHRETVYPYGVQIPHMEYYDVCAKFKNVKVVNDDVTCRILRMSTEERSGFKVRRISGDVHVGRYDITVKDFHVETPNSLILTDARLEYNTWKGMKGYVSTVRHEAELKEGTHVAMSDVAYWAPVLWGVDVNVSAEGTAHGKVDSLTTDMIVQWGQKSGALVIGSVRGLPKIDTTVFDVEIERLRTNVEDMSPLIEKLHASRYLRKIFNEIEYVNLDATVKGGLQDQAAVNMQLEARPGQVRVDAGMKQTRRGIQFTVDAGSECLGLALLESDLLTHTGFDISSAGLWRPKAKGAKALEVDFDGHLMNSMVRGRQLSAVELQGGMKDGVLSATVSSHDSAATVDLAIEADLADSVRHYNADLDIAHFDLGLLPKALSTHLIVEASGNDPDDLSVAARTRSLRYGDLKIKDIDLTIDAGNGEKDIALTSSVANATVSGRFDYSELPAMVRHFTYCYLPEIFNPMPTEDSVTLAGLEDNTLRFHLLWKDDGRTLHGLTKNIGVARGSRIDGSYNLREQLKVVMRSDSVRVGSLLLENVGMSGRPWGNRYSMEIQTQSFNIGELQLFEHLNITTESNREQSTVGMKWGDANAPTHGDVALVLNGEKITVEKPYFYVGTTQWMLDAQDMTLGNGERVQLKSKRISAESSNQKINASLSLSGQPNDYVELNFERFSLGLLSEILLQETPIDARGDINGRFSLYGLAETPYFNTNLQIDSCVVNQQPLGTVHVNSNWNAELNILNLQLASRELRAVGWMGLGDKEQDLNFNIDFNGFELKLIAPFLSAFSNEFGGELDGNIDLNGTTRRPLILGEAHVSNGVLHIDATDVSYYFSDSIMLSNNLIEFNDFDLRDNRGNTATINGEIRYNSLEDIRLDLGLTTDNLLVLDKKGGDQFSGTLLASATGRVTGTTDKLDISVEARTNPGCEVTVPVSYQKTVKSQNYITFVSDDEEPESDEDANATQRRSTMNLVLDLKVTPDTKINLPMDFSEVGVTVATSGSGDLLVNLRGNDAPKVMGNYELTSGKMDVLLFSVYEKDFTIESGSSINFQGNVPDTRFDIRAKYSQRVNLSTLTGNLSTIDNTQKYLQVENIIAIAGTLNDPKIGFDLQLPNADQSVEEEVFAYIDRNSERDMLNQTLSLLMRGSFYNVNNNSQNASGGNALDVVTSFMGNRLTDMVQFVDVNIDYRSATDYTKEQFDVNISKDWGRWYLESTLGYGGESRELESSNLNGTTIIDALVGYRISPLVHLFAYNRTNTNDYTRIDLPYKQGVGVKLTKDFDRWGDLFKRKKKRKK